MRSSLPKPFVRPSVAVSSAPSAARTWQDIPVNEVLTGDTVVDYGLVTSVTKGAEFNLVKFKSGHEIDSRFVTSVRAFHPVA